ncbi:MAG: SxtJ family membrane protein [Desulfobulbaceae bacterium]|nr:SxtJ family membrane protein [Desulfobulbaceae bacterium]
MQSINKNPDRKELRNFGIVTGVLTPVFFGLLLPWIFSRGFPVWPWIAGGNLFVLGFVLPVILKPVYRIWMTIGFYLGWINTRIILSIMFYCIILPVGIVRRLLGRDSMARTLGPKEKSYRVTSSDREKKHVERPF